MVRTQFHKTVYDVNLSYEVRKCNERHSAANLVRQIHVVNGFVKVAPGVLRPSQQICSCRDNEPTLPHVFFVDECS